VQSDWLPVGNCENGSIRTKRSLESEDPISIETHRMSLRLTGKSMPLTTSSRIRNMPNRRPRSTSGWLSATITACRSAQEWQDLQGCNPDHKLIQFESPSRVRTAGTRPRAEVKGDIKQFVAYSSLSICCRPGAVNMQQPPTPILALRCERPVRLLRALAPKAAVAQCRSQIHCAPGRPGRLPAPHGGELSGRGDVDQTSAFVDSGLSARMFLLSS
jgi:hypothetical protein